MGHGKLKKFAENLMFRCLLQPVSDEVMDRRAVAADAGTESPFRGLRLKEHPVKGHWNERMFAAAQPVVLELGCGRGEYTIGLAEREPARNYIGVDIKGARLWKGAKYATEHELPNVAFLRTRIEFIEAFFAPGEVSEIWLTFSDPQLRSENSRLTSPLFLERYRKFLKPGGVVHLKTDSRFLHEYSLAVARANGLRILSATTDLYGPADADTRQGRQRPAPATGSRILSATTDLYGPADADARQGRQRPAPATGSLQPHACEYAAASAADAPTSYGAGDGCGSAGTSTLGNALFEVQTFYERMFLRQGCRITYLAFTLDHDGPYLHPSDFDADYWRSVEGPRKFIRNV